jgi:hypothetical protein
MKSLLVAGSLILLVASAVGAAESPIDKGSMTIGGTAYFNSQSGERYENFQGDGYTEIGIMPEFGYFIAPGIKIGASLAFVSASQGDESATLFGIGPNVTYYFNLNKERTEVKGAVYPYIGGFFSYATTSNGVDLTETSFGGRGGINLMLSQAVAVDFGLQFSSESLDPDGFDSISGTTLSLLAGIQAFIW